MIAELLAEHRVARVHLREAFAQRALDRVIRLRDGRQIRLGLDREILGEIALERDRIGDIGQREGELQVIRHGA